MMKKIITVILLCMSFFAMAKNIQIEYFCPHGTYITMIVHNLSFEYAQPESEACGGINLFYDNYQTLTIDLNRFKEALGDRLYDQWFKLKGAKIIYISSRSAKEVD